MNDDTAPVWDGALLQAMNARFEQANARTEAMVALLEREADRLTQAIKQADVAARWRQGGDHQPGPRPAPGDEP